MQNVFFNLEDEWIKKAKRYVAFYNFKHVDEEPINFSALVREALREYLKDGLNISEIFREQRVAIGLSGLQGKFNRGRRERVRKSKTFVLR